MASNTKPTLNATVRAESGKGVARKLRAQGLIPAICYGTNTENISLAMDPAEFDKIMDTKRQINSVFHIALDNGTTVENVMLRDYQFDPIRRVVIHADLVVVDMNTPVQVSVPIEPTGRAKGVRMGGRLRVIQPVVKIAACPDDIPEEIVVDVTELAPDGAIMASELTYPEGVEPAYKMDYALLRIQMPRKKVTKEEDAKGKKAKKAG
ncbi:50S ribosomal protein L25 [Bradymonadaceae bacterium TMQ3]|uniref:Large ribosomal subunit protein bL25 n=1 Tax=Lujinxingia sediminis TaxID=2480984 RepID=A0ABY0CWB0_9DELT|nr:50S ribosomal protein L25 [Lujinxingia sediminis]RDV39787.1 50S ribosomal protein L25 [Bradymonadaceae bacterium TMQ3]RVU48168.1 50S ribosomal protein L25 [Lujinxingia sediminis]TXC77468.1 50S ribosomal protein L25 [Bradymonadales bacterium TMQ1]